MKTTKLVMLVMTIAVALFLLIPNLSWAADDGATTFKAKCAMCHGADAAGKPAMKAPSLVSGSQEKVGRRLRQSYQRDGEAHSRGKESAG
jgi:cytochrome c553